MTTPTQGEHAQTEALRLAEEFERDGWIAGTKQWCAEASAELRRLHAQVAALTQPAQVSAVESNTAGAALTYKQAVGSRNCMQCCVSYMLGLPLESVPDFATDGGWELFSEFVEAKGYAAVMLPGNREFEADYLASGTTERCTSHMVVMNDGKLVHDPHPSNAGLIEVQCVWLLAKRAAPPVVQADEHAAFEAVAKADTSNVSFIRYDTGYVDMTAALLWHGWQLRASHGQAPAGAAPEGWKLVPVKPTFAMVQAGLDKKNASAYVSRRVPRIYESMLNAAPSAPTAQAAPAAGYDHGPQSLTVAEAARHVGKWLNERPNHPLDLRDVAMLCAHAQKAPAAGAVAGPEFVQCSYGDGGYACCEGGPCQADMHNEQIAAAPTPAAQADSVLEDAARWQFVESAPSAITLRLHNLRPDQRAQYVDAARKQGGKHD